MNCRICGASVDFLESVSDIEYESYTLRDKPFQNQTRQIHLYHCPVCTHMQTEYLLDDDYYDEYDELKGSSQYSGLLDMTEEKLEKLHTYSINSSRFIDIGCGAGYALGIASNLYNHCVGVEPGLTTYQAAVKTSLASQNKRKDIQLINGYFDKHLKLEDQFSAFSAFQVFEHLYDIAPVLDYAYEVLEPGGVGLVNVPNGQAIYRNALYHQLTFEHINYFTPLSLATMAQKSGFDTIEVVNVPETIELDLYVRKPVSTLSVNAVREQLGAKLRQMLSPYQEIILWGAGAKSSKYAALLGNDLPIKHFVDSSPAKKGKYVAGLNISVEAVSTEIVGQADAIVIAASSYNKEIMDALRHQYGYQKAIVFFENDDVCLSFEK